MDPDVYKRRFCKGGLYISGIGTTESASVNKRDDTDKGGNTGQDVRRLYEACLSEPCFSNQNDARNVSFQETDRSRANCSGSWNQQDSRQHTNKLVKRLRYRCRFCTACKCSYSSDTHFTSISHLLSTKIPKTDAGYSIPQWNRGYKLLKMTGWDEFEGLGKNSEGRRYPVRTVLKRDRQGFGLAAGAPKVTHFEAHDPRAIESVKKVTQKELKFNQTREWLREKQKEIEFRLLFRDEY